MNLLDKAEQQERLLEESARELAERNRNTEVLRKALQEKEVRNSERRKQERERQKPHSCRFFLGRQLQGDFYLLGIMLFYFYFLYWYFNIFRLDMKTSLMFCSNPYIVWPLVV